MKRGFSVLETVIGIGLVMLGGGGIVNLYSRTSVNETNINTNKTSIEQVRSVMLDLAKNDVERAKEQAFINGKLDTILRLNNVNPKYIEQEIERQILASSTNQSLAL